MIRTEKKWRATWGDIALEMYDMAELRGKHLGHSEYETENARFDTYRYDYSLGDADNVSHYIDIATLFTDKITGDHTITIQVIHRADTLKTLKVTTICFAQGEVGKITF